MSSKQSPTLPSALTRHFANGLKRAPRSPIKSETMRLRVSPEQKRRIISDAGRFGLSATELLLQLHRIACSSLGERGLQ